MADLVKVSEILLHPNFLRLHPAINTAGMFMNYQRTFVTQMR